QADAGAVDLGARAQVVHAGARVGGEVEGRRGGEVAGGLADAAIVGAEHRPAGAGERVGDRGERAHAEDALVAILRARPGQQHHRGRPGRVLRAGERGGELDVAARIVDLLLDVGRGRRLGPRRRAREREPAVVAGLVVVAGERVLVELAVERGEAERRLDLDVHAAVGGARDLDDLLAGQALPGRVGPAGEAVPVGAEVELDGQRRGRAVDLPGPAAGEPGRVLGEEPRQRRRRRARAARERERHGQAGLRERPGDRIAAALAVERRVAAGQAQRERDRVAADLDLGQGQAGGALLGDVYRALLRVVELHVDAERDAGGELDAPGPRAEGAVVGAGGEGQKEDDEEKRSHHGGILI